MGKMVLYSHPRLHYRQAAGQRDVIVGSLNDSVGLNSSDHPAKVTGPSLKERLQPRR